MANPENVGVFLPTTNVWDVSEIYSTEVTSPEFKELLVRLYQNLNLTAQGINVKDSGMYVRSEFVNGQTFFQNPTNTTNPSMRQAYRMVVNFGALPNTTTKSVAHNIPITSAVTVTRIYGAATNPSTGYIPIPYSSITAVADNIELSMTSANIVIKTGADQSAYTVCYVVVEYLKS
jgi:hypothetical protein